MSGGEKSSLDVEIERLECLSLDKAPSEDLSVVGASGRRQPGRGR